MDISAAHPRSGRYTGNYSLRRTPAGSRIILSSGTSTIGGSSACSAVRSPIPGAAPLSCPAGISGYGNVAGFTDFGASSITASGGTAGTPQTLFVNAGAGTPIGISSGAGASMSSGANNTLDLKGTFNAIQPRNIYPNGGTVNLDGATLALTVSPSAITLNPGTVNVTNNSVPDQHRRRLTSAPVPTSRSTPV